MFGTYNQVDEFVWHGEPGQVNRYEVRGPEGPDSGHNEAISSSQQFSATNIINM